MPDISYGQNFKPNSIQDVLSQVHAFDEKPPSDQNYPPVFDPPKLSEYPPFEHKPQPIPDYNPKPILDYKPHPIKEILTPIHHQTTKKPKKIIYKMVHTKAPKYEKGTTKRIVYKLATKKPKTTSKPTQHYHEEIKKEPVIKHKV